MARMLGAAAAGHPLADERRYAAVIGPSRCDDETGGARARGRRAALREAGLHARDRRRVRRDGGGLARRAARPAGRSSALLPGTDRSRANAYSRRDRRDRHRPRAQPRRGRLRRRRGRGRRRVGHALGDRSRRRARAGPSCCSPAGASSTRRGMPSEIALRARRRARRSRIPAAGRPDARQLDGCSSRSRRTLNKSRSGAETDLDARRCP